MSRLAQAGDSSTVSPGARRALPRRTASCIDAARLRRAHARERRCERRRILADQHDVPHLAANAAASGAKSWPLPSPPAIITSGPGMPATAAMVAPTLVPLESSM